MDRGDRRFDHSPITLEHASARGKIQRNAGTYTRGAGLIGQKISLWRSGTRLPVFVWLGLFIAITWIMMSYVMSDHEIELCSWRVGSALWTWMDLNPLKPMNIVLADGTIRKTSIGYIPYLPDVQIACIKASKALAGSFLAASLLAFPAITWFVHIANKLGAGIMEEHHERGATLVAAPLLYADIIRHNQRKFEEAAARLFPGMTPNEVHRLPFAARKSVGLHHPYTLAGIPYPYNLEASHTIVIGTTGSGKTTQLRALTTEIRARQDSAVIFDLTGDFVKAFYNPETDTILNPGDARCPTWSLFDECSTQAEFTAASHAIVPNDGGGGDPFWILAARGLFVQMCLKLEKMGQTTNQALADHLMNASLEHITALLSDTSASPYTSAEAGKLAQSVRSVFNANAEAFLSLPTDGPGFSISDWIRKPDKPGSILFVTARYVDMALYKMLLTLWLDVAINTLMTLSRSGQLRTWFLFDEVGALHRLPAIENGLQTARGYGGAIVLGLHSFARLQAVYGKEGAENLTSLARTKLILATADRSTAEQCSEYIGFREVRQMDEAYAYSANSHRDVATLTPKKEIAPLVIPDDITNLPSLHGFIKFPDGFSAARIVLQYRDYPEVAKDFEPRTDGARRPKKRPVAPEAEDKLASGQDNDARLRNIDKPLPEQLELPGTQSQDKPSPTEPMAAQPQPEPGSDDIVGNEPPKEIVPTHLQDTVGALADSFGPTQETATTVNPPASDQFGDASDQSELGPQRGAGDSFKAAEGSVDTGATTNDNAPTKEVKHTDDPASGIMKYEIINDFSDDRPVHQRHHDYDDGMEL